MTIKFNDLGKHHELIKADVLEGFKGLLERSDFILGKAVTEFEKDFAAYIGSKYAIGVSNGTDAIKLCLEALGLKGKTGIIMPANTYIATTLGAEMAYPDAELVLIDADKYFEIDIILLEKYLEQNRKRWDNCILLPVHLYGQTCDMDAILSLSKKYNCFVVEDASQAQGARFKNGKRAGSAGIVSAFSLYPGKNLGAMGDAGIITTDDDSIYKKLLLLRNWGSTIKYHHEVRGYNNRLDTIQAIVLKEKLKHLDTWNNERARIASLYDELIQNPLITKPEKASYCNTHIYHIYCILCEKRDKLIEYLTEKQIPTVMHYPIPIELTKVYKHLNFNNPKTRKYSETLLSLPMHPFLTNEEVNYIADTINKF